MRAPKRSTWALWHIAVWVSFAVLEYRAIRGREATLSEWTRVLVGRRDAQRRGRHFAQAAFTALLLWFWGHILLDWGPYLNEGNRVSLRPRKAAA